jgi:hypothetical protein
MAAQYADESVDDVPIYRYIVGHILGACMRTLFIALVPLSFATAVDIADVRIGPQIGVLSGFSSEFRYTAGPQSAIQSGTYENNEDPDGDPHGIAASYTSGHLGDHGGFLWGAEVSWLTMTETVFDEDFDTDILTASFRFGYGVAIHEKIHLEAMAMVGTGLIWVDDADLDTQGNIDRSRADGWIATYGIEVGAYGIVWRQMLVGASVSIGHADASYSADFSQTGGSYDADSDWTQVVGKASVGWRF